MNVTSAMLMTTVSRQRHWAKRVWLALTVALGSSACSSAVQQPAAHPEPPKLAPDCLEYAHVQEALADLGLQAMQAFGRIDPALYAPDEGGGLKLVADPGAVAPERVAPFQAALARVNADPKARAALFRGYHAATGGCVGGSCPPKSYSITVTPRQEQLGNDRQYTWQVKGDEPTAREWKAFETLYAPRPALCPVLASLVLRSRTGGDAQTSGLFDKESRARAAALHPCPCNYNNEPGRLGRPCTTCGGYFRACSPELPEPRARAAEGAQSSSAPSPTGVQ